MLETLNAIDGFVWGPPLLVLLIGTGLMLTVRLHLLQVFRLPRALKLIFTAKNQGEGDVDSFKALCTALAATVGTGNIVGVATAVHAGGPMYYIENGLGKKYKPLAFLFAFFGVLVAFFGIGTFAQVNSIVEITRLTTSIPVEYTAIVLTILVAAITIGGLQSIARVASKIVPAMAVIYVVSTVAFLVVFADQIPAAVEQIIVSAFTPTAAAGGFLGATVLVAMRNGVARGVFSNESGLGSAPIVAAAAKTKWPAEQGLISMTGTFIDTIIICTLTGLVLVVSGAWMGDVNGAALTNAAFTMAFPTYGSIILCVGLTLFAFTTILGWNYYGERCVEYLVGVKGIMPYRIIFIALVACGAFIKLDVIWVLADIVNGLMAIPNLIALIGLSGVVVAETKKYFAHLKEEEMVVAKDSEEKVPAGH